MEYYLILVLLFHWIADFVCQSDWMAANKSKDWKALTAHVGVYTLVLYVAMLILVVNVMFTNPHQAIIWYGSSNPFQATLLLAAQWTPLYLFVGVNAIAHLLTDAITSRITSKLWAINERHWFFVVIGFDQFLHTAILIITFKMYMLG